MGFNLKAISQSKWIFLLADFANVLKAFIGTNYLSLSYAFSKSGAVLGLLLLVFIAGITDHCCQLLVKCKYYAMDVLLWRFDSSNPKMTETTKHQRLELESHLQTRLTYGDIGMVAFGQAGRFIVNFCVFLTQFGFCVGYCIFIGNTLFSFFPLKAHCVLPQGNITRLNLPSTSVKQMMGTLAYAEHAVKVPETHLPWNCSSPPVSNSDTLEDMPKMSAAAKENAVLLNHSYFSNFLSSNSSSSHVVFSSDAPQLYLLILLPLPIFIVFSFIKNLRFMGAISICADVAIVVGWIFLLVFLFIDFKINPEVKLASNDAAVFFGLVTSAFEGVGTIIPIETSMDGNRHNFPKFLHFAIAAVSFLLVVLGLTGYLRFGNDVNQMINLSIIHGGIYANLLNVCLLVAVICTYPLMAHPVLEMLENIIFSSGNKSSENGELDSEQDTISLLNTLPTNLSLPVTKSAAHKIVTWKRNVVRLSMVLSSIGFAILFQHNFAHLTAILGSIGGTLLLFILPSIFELKLCWSKISTRTVFKNITITLFGLTGSISSLYAILREMTVHKL